MKQNNFENNFNDRWDRFELLLNELSSPTPAQRKKRHNPAIGDFPQLYREICRDLSLAVQRRYSPRLLDRLNRLALGGHRHLYKRDTEYTASLLRFIAHDFPAQIRRDAAFVGTAAALFCIPGILVFLIIMAVPEFIYSVMDAAQVNSFEMMYDPNANRIGTERAAETDVMMFGYYIKNNIGIGFRSFALGITAGIGTAFILIVNGIALAALSAHVIHLGFQQTFFPFVIGHGSFELTAIVFSGAAGLKLGYALIAPGAKRRVDALRTAATESIVIVYGVIAMLITAAFLEAFWSSKPELPIELKLSVGALMWILIAAYFVAAGRRRSA